MNHGQESQGRIISIHAPQWGATIWFRWSNWITRISIHAPQWGATYLAVAVVVEQSISIHAPQWGATISLLSAWTGKIYFNPRTPVGCDSTLQPRGNSLRDFNPRTPVGCDNLVKQMAILRDISIHAPQWGATAIPCWICYGTEFQSTHPSGVRLIRAGPYGSPRFISIHAPQWGATKAWRDAWLTG